MTTRPLGSTGLQVTALCVGTSPLASMPRLYGYEVSEQQAIDTINAVLDSRGAINLIDTSNGYGNDGSAEKRIGGALRRRRTNEPGRSRPGEPPGGRRGEQPDGRRGELPAGLRGELPGGLRGELPGGLPAGTILATKVDPDPYTGDFSGKRVRQSLEESMERLGLDHIDLLHLHDPERISFDEGTAPGGPVDTLADLKREGLVSHLGVAGGPVALMRPYLDTGVFEVVLTHNRYTLLDRSAETLFRTAHEQGIGVLNAAPYGGGMLAKGPETQTQYAYGQRDDAIATAAAAMRAAANRADVSLAAVALQFSLRAPFVDSTVVGVSSPERVTQTLELASVPIPDALWEEMEALVPESSLWLDPPGDSS